MSPCPATIRAAAAAWKIRRCRSEDDFWQHLQEFIAEAHSQGCQLLVLPEFITLELDGMFGESVPLPQERSAILAHQFQRLQDQADELLLTIVCGSAFERASKGWVNRSTILRPHHPPRHQDKQILTQWELVEWCMEAGEALASLDGSPFGVLVCYDSEFPALALPLCEAGALALCVPSYTETWHGHWRVRHSCHARSIENQIFTLHAPLVGSLGREPVIESHGSAAIIAPSVPPFPANGVLAELMPDQEGIAVADLDFEDLLSSRRQGDVRNWDDRLRAARSMEVLP